MVIEQEIKKFLEANTNIENKETKYQGQITNYECDEQEKKHKVTVDSCYQIEKTGDLHPDLLTCLQNKEKVDYY